MTNDYYVNLANYYTNQLVSEPPAEAITLTASNKLINFYDYFTYTLGASSYTIDKWLTWDGSSNIILYGTIEVNSVSKNYILRIPYTDNNFDLTNAECYTTYVGGTELPYFWDLKVDTDGSLYGIVASSTSTSNGFSLIMLANPFITGGIKFRQSYAIPTTYSSYGNYQELIKRENTGEYLIILNDGGANTLILHLTINVGGSNDWVATTVNDYLEIYDYFISWGENISLNILNYDASGELTDYSVKFNVYNYNGSSITLTNTYSYSIGTRFKTATAKYFDEENVYYLVSYLSNYDGGSGTTYNYLYKANMVSGNTTILKTSATPNNPTSPYSFLADIGNSQQIEIINGVVYYKYTITLLPHPNRRRVYGIVINDKIYEVTSRTLEGTFSLNPSYNSFFVNNIFNIYKIVCPLSQITDFVDFQYDPNGYNGTPYIDTNFFIPYRVELYDSSSLLFDRGLYNLKVYSNVTESTFNIPNTMLNSETISKAKLYGETLYNLVDSTINITKNIYENLMINFFNSIVVKDYTGRIYNSGGSRVNDSISKTNDMGNASANKLKIFYSDGTSQVQQIPTPTIAGSGNPMTITYEILLYVASDGYVSKYQVLSNDENTLYFEYDTSSLNTGTYKITQECSVE